MELEKILNWRYSTKSFDPTKKISETDFEQLKALLQMSPSSTNLQPWHYVIAHTEEGKKQLAKGTQGNFQFNEPKMLNASHVVLFCSRTSADLPYMQQLSAQEEADGRYPTPEVKQMVFNARNMFADIHRYDAKDLQHWMEKQVYLSIGFFLLGVAALGLDALPMEGIDTVALDKELGLREKGYTALVAVAVGYRAEADFNATDKTPKSRLPEEELFTLL